MKKFLFFLVGGVFLTVTACQKGENDPSLSLSTRKARLAGEYTIDAWSNSYKNSYSNGDVEEVRLNVTGSTGTLVTTYTPDGSGTSTTTNHAITFQKATFSFDKNGTWSMALNTTETWSDYTGGFFIDHEDYTQIETGIETGTWAFLPAQGDEFKNKERILLSVLNAESTSQLNQITVFNDGSTNNVIGSIEGRDYTYANGEVSVIYEIDRLAGTDMIFIQDVSGTDIYKSTDGGITYTASIAQTGALEIKMSEN